MGIGKKKGCVCGLFIAEVNEHCVGVYSYWVGGALGLVKVV